MKLTKTQWILVAIAAAIIIYLVFFRKKNTGTEESGYKLQCGPDDRGVCIGCQTAKCPEGSDMAGANSQGCQCFDGACLPSCSATGGSYVYNPSTGSWTFISKRKKKSSRKPVSFMS